MTGTPQMDPERAHQPGERALAPIRWPHPDAATVGLLLLWVAGMLLAVLVPAVIVPPTSKSASTGDVGLAFGCTVLGALVMFTSASVISRRNHDSAVMFFGAVPAFSVIVGGVIIAASKLAG